MPSTVTLEVHDINAIAPGDQFLVDGVAIPHVANVDLVIRPGLPTTVKFAILAKDGLSVTLPAEVAVSVSLVEDGTLVESRDADGRKTLSFQAGLLPAAAVMRERLRSAILEGEHAWQHDPARPAKMECLLDAITKALYTA